MALLALFLQSGHREPHDDGDVLPRLTGCAQGPGIATSSGADQSLGGGAVH